jgi:hypothetical protein
MDSIFILDLLQQVMILGLRTQNELLLALFDIGLVVTK